MKEDPQQRAERILAAAGELILRWGYDKTTIDDIARTAGVAKGTIYLHWKTREELFVALVRHERRGMVADIRSGIEGDPYGLTIAGVIRQMFMALERRPLVKAFLLRDSDVIGKLLRRAGAAETKVMSRAALIEYLEALREHGLVRTDVSVAAQANLVTATITGFLLAEPMMLGEHRAMDEEAADLMADAIERLLAPGRRANAAKRKLGEQATRGYVDQMADVTDVKYQKSVAGASSAAGGRSR